MRNPTTIIKYGFLPLLFTLLSFSAASGATLASESFATPGGYQPGEPMGYPENAANVIGNQGFSETFLWNGRSALIIPVASEGLEHPLLAGSTAPGHVRLRAGGTGPEPMRRVAFRFMDAAPQGDVLYLGGLVSAEHGLWDFREGDQVSMGLSSHQAFREERPSYRSGVFFGYSTNLDMEVRLAAFGNGEVLPISEPLEPPDGDRVHLIVLRVEFGSGRQDDSLTAWYAGPDDQRLTEAWRREGLDLGDPEADFEVFGVQTFASELGHPEVNAGAAFDEFRFGTDPQAVVRVR